MNDELTLRPVLPLAEAHAALRRLYQSEYPQGAPHLYERLLPRLPEFIRAIVVRKLNDIVEAETGKKKPYTDLSKAERDAFAMFLDMQVWRAHIDVGRDAALSNSVHSICHADTQPLIVAHDLITVASSEHPESLQRMGCVFIDVDGTKTLVDCTSHAHAGKYLEALAEFLSRPPEPVREWLSQRNLHTEVYAVAGDEFIVILRSENQPVTRELLDEFASVMQAALTSDPKLAAFFDFNDPDFIMEYDDWSDDDRRALKRDSGSMEEKLMSSREKLPERFIPSVSCGSATLYEALCEALSPDTEEARTLEELGVNTFRGMVALADARLKEAKREFRRTMDDPKWREFFSRNAENRRLIRYITELQGQLDAALRTIDELRGTEGDTEAAE